MPTVPMPRPSDRDAPRFRGKNITDFLDDFENCAARSGIATTEYDDKLPSMVVKYCGSSVAKEIRHWRELKAKDWAALKKKFIELYGAEEHEHRASEKQLKTFVAKARTIGSRRDLDEYTRRFLMMAEPLLEQDLITKRTMATLFLKGLGDTVARGARVRIDLAAQHAAAQGATAGANAAPANPRPSYTTFDEALAAARACVSLPDDPLASDEESDGAESSSGDISDSASDASARRARRKRKAIHKIPAPGPTTLPPVKADAIDKLAEGIERLHMQLERMQAGPAASPSAPNATAPRATRAGGEAFECFMCGEVNTTHRHMRNCPETAALVREGLIQYSPAGTLQLADGSQLPRRVPGMGGIAAAVRALYTEDRSSGKQRERAPHLDVPGASGSHTVGMIEAVWESEDSFSDGGYSWRPAEAYPVTRSQAAGKEQRYDPRKRPAPPPRSSSPPPMRFAVPPSTSVPPAPAPAPAATVPPPTPPAPASAPAPEPHPTNTEKGWKDEKKKKKSVRIEEETEDVPMKPPAKPRGSYRYTSDVQEGVSVSDITTQMLETPITIPIRSLLAASPELQKTLASMTKTRREYMAPSTEYTAAPSEYTTCRATSEAQVHIGAHEQPAEILHRYAHAVSMDSSKFYAKAVCTLTAVISGQPVNCMVDTGAELSIMSRSVYDRLRLAMDTDGRRWSLRGISGNTVDLAGCVHNVPLEVSGRTFPTHIFVSARDLGRHDVILGQPFLDWFSARIDFTRGGAASLSIFKDGIPSDYPIVIPISSTDPSRDTDKLVMTATADHYASDLEQQGFGERARD